MVRLGLGYVRVRVVRVRLGVIESSDYRTFGLSNRNHWVVSRATASRLVARSYDPVQRVVVVVDDGVEVRTVVDDQRRRRDVTRLSQIVVLVLFVVVVFVVVEDEVADVGHVAATVASRQLRSRGTDLDVL